MLYTFVAGQPRGFVPSVASPADAADIVGLSRLRDRLESTTGEHHAVHRAATLADIVLWFRTRALHVGPGDHLQLVGHGRPGVLHLGSTWTGTIANAAEVYALDANPERHRMLRPCVDGGSVVLAGCHVGADSTESGDGPTLLFALHRLWGCTVAAPVGLVSPDDFDAAGRFRSIANLVVARDRGVSSPRT